jgi:uncharacterized protein YbjT (DUF2867 family)
MPINPSDKLILITGATGNQGGAAARCLLAAGWRLRALVRDPQKPAAQQLAARGIEVVRGDLNDRPSIDAAVAGAYGAYSVQHFMGKGADEVGQGKRLADAAKAAGVAHFVYSSGAATERGVPFAHFRSKWEIEQHIQSLGLACTVLRPTYFMECLTDKKMYPAIAWGVLRDILGTGTRLQMIACDDIGVFVAKAFADPQGFIGRSIELAGDEVSYADALEAFKATMGKKPFHFPFSMAVMRKLNKDVHGMFEWFRESRYRADIPALRAEHPGLRGLKMFFNQRKAAVQ